MMWEFDDSQKTDQTLMEGDAHLETKKVRALLARPWVSLVYLCIPEA
jgi:hypothetical protein